MVLLLSVRNLPGNHEISLLRPSTTAAIELRARRTVDGQREKILVLCEVRKGVCMSPYVSDAKTVEHEDDAEDRVKDASLPHKCMT